MGVMDWYFNNIQSASRARAAGQMQARADLMQEYAPQAQDIIGMPAAGPPDMYGNQPQGPTGLMAADPNDPMSFISAGAGLMQLPGYGQFANTFLSQAISNQLGRPMQQAQLDETRRMNNARLQQSMYQWQMEQAAKQAQRGGLDFKQQQEVTNALADDARAAVQPYRQSIELYNTVNDVIGARGGYTNMQVSDDELLMKSYAKMLLPNEAVMTDDINRIARSGSLNDIVKGMANKISLGIALLPEERDNLWRSMNTLMKSKLPQYEEERRYFQQRALDARLDPSMILRNAIAMDARTFERPGFSSKSESTLSPEMNQQLTEQADREQGRPFSVFDPNTWFQPQ